MLHSRFFNCSSALALIGSISGLANAVPAKAQAVTDRTVSEVSAEYTENCVTLTVNFNVRVQVLSSFPAIGRELHMRILPLEAGAANGLREGLSLPPNAPELRSVEYDGGNPAGPTLSLLFNTEMNFEVMAGQNPRSVVIRVAKVAAGSACSADRQGTADDTTKTAQLIGDAEQAIIAGEIDRAIQLLTNAGALPQNPSSARAMELLGLMRERQGQTAQARAQYEEYLREFPGGEGADRVRQRLAALNGGAQGAGTAQQLRAPTGTIGGSSDWKWALRGSLSQYYFRDEGRTSTLNTSATLGTEVDNSVNVNQLLNTGDITVTGGNGRQQVQMRASGSYTKNFGTSRSITTINQGSEVRSFSSRPGGGITAVTALYLDYSDKDLGGSLRVGRQTRNSSGVLGRFDGALLGWQAKPTVRLNVVGGFPVLSSRQTSVMTERPFYGVSLDVGNKRSAIQTTFYWFDQRARGGFVDRQSAGVEARYVRKNFNVFGIVDYDVKYSTLNLGLISMGYNFNDGSNLALTADYRKSPLLTTTNALIGQFDTVSNLPFGDLRGLRPFFTDAQIYQLARDRTLVAKSVTATYTRPLTKHLQFSTDLSMTDTGGTPGTPATAGTPEVGALPAMGKEYFFGAQLIGTDMLMANDTYILSGRYADTATSRIYTVDLNARVPVSNSFRVSPRLRYGYRDGKITSSAPVPGTFKQFQPTLRLNYFPFKRSEIEIEMGGNFTQQSVYSGTAWDRVSEKGWVLTAGYRLDF